MINASRARAESHFAALAQRQDRALLEVKEQSRVVDENTARLRALRLAKEASTPAPTPVKRAKRQSAAAKSRG